AGARWGRGRGAGGLAEMSQLRSLQDATGRLHVRMCVAMALGRLAAGLGQEDEARGHLAEALATAEPLGVAFIAAAARSALGLLELGAGRHAAAAAHFDLVTAVAGHVREPGIVLWLADAVEAYHGCGRRAEAEEALGRLEALAGATGRLWAVAAAARSAAI